MDENADGIWNEGEGVMPNVTVSLINEKDEQQVYTTQSGADGVYTLDQVRPGNYKLSFTCPEGWMFTRYSSTGGERRSIITTEGRRTASKSINLEAGETLDLQHVGMMREATVEGMAFLDANYNGLYDAGEAPSGRGCGNLQVQWRSGGLRPLRRGWQLPSHGPAAQ